MKNVSLQQRIAAQRARLASAKKRMKEKNTYKEAHVLKSRIGNDAYEKVNVGIYGEDSSPKISPNQGSPVSVGYKYVGGGMYEKELKGESKRVARGLKES